MKALDFSYALPARRFSMKTVPAGSTPEEKQYGNSLTALIARTQLRALQKTLPLRVLSEEDFKHWQTYGFVVVRQAVPAENVKRLVDFLWQFQEMDPDNPETWSGGQLRSHGM